MNCFLELDCFRVSSAWGCRIGRHFLPLIPILLLSPLTAFDCLSKALPEIGGGLGSIEISESIGLSNCVRYFVYE